MPYLFHYTSKDGFGGIKGATGISHKNGGTVSEDTGAWTPMVNQPQKHVLFKDQHEEGFYLTDISPEELDNDTSAKLGINMTVDNLYVFAFVVDGSATAGFQLRNGRNVKRVKNTRKWYLTTSGVNEKASGILQVTVEQCYWCGPVSKFPG